MSDDLIFEEPPPILRGLGALGQTELGRWLDALRSHPGQWARFHRRVASANATNIRRGGYGTTPGEFKVRTVRSGEGSRVHLYACYVGGES